MENISGDNGLSGKAPVLYFAYGANMNPAQIATRIREPRFVTAARLPSYRLGFYGYTERWDGGQETVSWDKNAEVWGTVWEVSADGFDRLDAWQGVKLDGTGAYYHCPADVIGTDGQTYATLMYKKANLGAAKPPSTELLAFIVEGARLGGLPPTYIDALAATPAIPAGYPVPKAHHTDKFLLSMAPISCAC